uniref:hypothetical protein Ycf39 n=1 Tax=Hypnea cervicornis TaxID=387623 RepID=UPI0021B4DD7B|nr:hypothetical protein Ycf39 [Hypnea cervicornis]UVW80750.1 hypothetical protein Ycf39 [Hypnea cervicornis]
MSLLILGGTGTLGRQIVRRALDEGFQVKCLVRSFRRSSFLKEWGAELVYGDLKTPETIPLTLVGITAIIDASSSRPSDLDNTTRIDLYSKYIIIEAAKKANIQKYIFFSLLNAYKYPDIPLISMKLKIEKALKESGLNYTIFTLAGFFQGLITQYALPILEKKSVWITESTTTIAYMDTQDIARLTIKSLSVEKSNKCILPLVGSYSWNSLEIIKLCEKLSGQRSRIIKIPVYLLKFTQQFTKLFQWSWNISDRLAFTEVISRGDDFNAIMNDVYDLLNIDIRETVKLDIYMQEYFTKIMKKLKELNKKEVIESTKF